MPLIMQGGGHSVTAYLHPSVSASHAVFGHAGQRTVCHNVTAHKCQCVTYCVWSCRAEDRLSQRNCNLVDNSVVMSLINQSMNRSVRTCEALLIIVCSNVIPLFNSCAQCSILSLTQLL